MNNYRTTVKVCCIFAYFSHKLDQLFQIVLSRT